ncbi:hypothetical protein ACQP3J_30125, partial [Escherichia coli]
PRQEDPQKQNETTTKEKAWTINCGQGMSEQELPYIAGEAATALETWPFRFLVSTQKTTPPSTQRHVQE